MTDPVIHLNTGGTSVVVVADAGRLPRIIHWGAPVDDADASALASAARPFIGDSPVTDPQPIPVVAQLSEGWLGRPGVSGSSSGTRWAPRFEGAQYVVAGSALRCEAVDEAYALGLVVELEVLPSGLVRTRATLTNDGDAPYRVETLEVALPVPSHADEVLDLAGRWALERVPQRRPFGVGAWTRASRGGKPGPENAVLMMAGEAGFGFRSGAVWGVHLAWSGNQVLAAERTPADTRRLSGAELLLPDEVVLQPGASYSTPWLLGSWGDGLDAMAARFHEQRRAEHPLPPRPVSLNTWEAVYFDHDLEQLVALAERGAAIGVERFVLDDGWFTGRRDDTTSLGDWTVDATIWPAGLEPLAKRVRELGLQFGLWFEPEMISLDSDLARAHPEWVFDAGHGPGLPSRQQHVLDLGHEEAYQHVFGLVSALVGRLSIDYIKWDHNRYLLDAGHSPDGRPGVRRQVEQLYRFLRELRQVHPGLEIESCAGGGGRIDLGVMQFADRVWSSDCNDPHERLEIQRWTGLLLPPEVQGTHIGAEVSHTTRRVTTLDYRAEKAIWGHLGLELNLLEASDAELEALAGWIAFHKQHRDLLHSGTVVHADLADQSLRLEGVVATDGGEALYAFSVVERGITWPPGRIRLPGLLPGVAYRVEAVFPGGGGGGQLPPWFETGVTLSGRALGTVGVEAPPLHPDRSVVLRATSVR